MGRLKFDIKFRPQIESGEYKVETRDGRTVRVICWDRAAKEDQPKDLKLCVLVPENGGEAIYYYYSDGTKWVKDACFDLFIVTPEKEEEELSEFDDCVRRLIDMAHSLGKDHPYNTDKGALLEHYSAELRELARNEIVKSGYAIVESEHYLEEGRKNYERGKAEALKDLPRWERSGVPHLSTEVKNYSLDGEPSDLWLLHSGWKINVKSLEKLPGFKEDSHE